MHSLQHSSGKAHAWACLRWGHAQHQDNPCHCWPDNAACAADPHARTCACMQLFVGMSLQQQPDELEEEEEQQAEEEPGKPKKTLFRRLLRKLKPRVIMPNERW